MATAADSVETVKGPRFSVRGVATRLRRPRLSFWRCTVMVPAEGEGRARCDVLSNHSLMAVVSLPPSPAPLSRERSGDWPDADPAPERPRAVGPAGNGLGLMLARPLLCGLSLPLHA